MNKIASLLVLCLFTTNGCTSVNTIKKATKIAEKEWINIYGESILKKKPYNIFLIGDSVWTVSGTLPPSGWVINEKGDYTFTMNVGGVPVIKIRKEDGSIIEIYHSK